MEECSQYAGLEAAYAVDQASGLFSVNRFLVQDVDRLWYCSDCGWAFDPANRYAVDSVKETLPEFISDRNEAFSAHRCDETSSAEVNPPDFA